jgi:hypothetical protein
LAEVAGELKARLQPVMTEVVNQAHTAGSDGAANTEALCEVARVVANREATANAIRNELQDALVRLKL